MAQVVPVYRRFQRGQRPGLWTCATVDAREGLAMTDELHEPFFFGERREPVV